MPEYNSDREVLDALSERFDPKVIQKNPKNFHYIQIDEVYNRLDDVLGTNWSLEVVDTRIEPINPDWKSYGRAEKAAFLAHVHVRVAANIGGGYTQRDGVGADFADDPDKAIKTALANAVKKAANGFGVGRYLWKAEERAAIDEANEARQNTKELKNRVVALYESQVDNDTMLSFATALPSAKLDILAKHFGVEATDLASAETLNKILEENA